MPKSLQILFRDARAAIEAAVRADLARNGFGDVAPAHSALLRDVGDDGARPSELAAHAGVTRQAITKLVDELERLDLVRRDPDPDDGRGVIVRYTDRGRAGVAIARKRMLALERAYAAQVGADRWAEVRSTLETLFGDDPRAGAPESATPAADPPDRPTIAIAQGAPCDLAQLAADQRAKALVETERRIDALSDEVDSL